MKRLAALTFATSSVLVACVGAGSNDVPPQAITVFGPWVDGDADAFAAVLGGFGGAEVRYTGSADFVRDLQARISSGVGVPDVALIPQPALIGELASTGDLVPFSDEVVAMMEGNFTPDSWRPSADGNVYSIPYRSNVKSLVWFRPDVFEANGWEIPTLLDELDALVEQITTETDIAPWCFSISAGGETGWPATDWVEDLVLRQAGADVYDRWVGGDVAFDDRAIREAFEVFDELVLSRGRAFGGPAWVVEVEVAKASEPMFSDPAGCAMYKQASFATSWFPTNTAVGPDGTVDFFMLPGTEVMEIPPLLVAGTGAVQLADRSEVSDLMAYLASPDGGRAWARRGGYISPRTNVDPDTYYRGTDVGFGALLQDAEVSRFDASDQFDSTLREAMLSGMTTWIAGRQTLDELLASLDAVRAPDD